MGRAPNHSRSRYRRHPIFLKEARFQFIPSKELHKSNQHLHGGTCFECYRGHLPKSVYDDGVDFVKVLNQSNY